ncbi:ATP-dependent RNA helicase [Pelomyxa schiedti]|nr:ATP-dependent RNA helicase [Pelomyxa schiedti]
MPSQPGTVGIDSGGGPGRGAEVGKGGGGATTDANCPIITEGHSSACGAEGACGSGRTPASHDDDRSNGKTGGGGPNYGSGSGRRNGNDGTLMPPPKATSYGRSGQRNSGDEDNGTTHNASSSSTHRGQDQTGKSAEHLQRDTRGPQRPNCRAESTGTGPTEPKLYAWPDHYCRLLSETFFSTPGSVIRKGSQDEKDFWDFLSKYESHKASSVHKPPPPRASVQKENRLGLPMQFDPRYKVNFSTMLNASRIGPAGLSGRKTFQDGHYSSWKSGDRVSASRDSENDSEPFTISMEQVSEFRKAVHLFADFQQKKKFDRLVKIRKDRQALPIARHAAEIVDTVQRNSVVVIAGDTGCGKSTQVPQYLLHSGFQHIACTQPRRIACMALCRRVAVETLNEFGTSIAYQVRFDTSKARDTRILFLTEGLLLRQAASDPLLTMYDVIIIDEVHERHLFGDFLLGVLRDLVLSGKRPSLKLVLMSATINVNMFSDYFAGAPVVLVPGRLFSIDVRYMPADENSSHVDEALALAKTVAAEGGKAANILVANQQKQLDLRPYLRVIDLIDQEFPCMKERGDVLIFMSGMKEILSLAEEVSKHTASSKQWIVLLLHSALSVEEQDKVFDIAPEGTRKCIISTNIAETSVTIDGIRFVVDSGKVKEMGYDQECKMQRLQEYWVSQASAEQRKGRAGRTGPGVCFRLYSRTEFNHFLPYTVPEILRVPLESVVLQIKALELGDPRVFKFVQSPGADVITMSVNSLKTHQALCDNSREDVTPLGVVLSRLPVEVPIGKILVLGTLFRVLEPLIVMAAALTVQSPFVMRRRKDSSSINNNDEQDAKEFFSDHGDPFTLLSVYNAWIEAKVHHEATRTWCRKRGIEEQRLYELTKLAEQFKELLQDAGLLDSSYTERTVLPTKRTNPHRKELRRLQVERDRARKRRVLSLKDDDFAADNEEKDEGSGEEIDIKDVDFMLSHDLENAHPKDHTLEREEITLLKAILCSGLYPNVALPDEHNAFHKESEQTYHTSYKEFVNVHPTSVFASCTDFQQTEVLVYVTLLHTNKPYITNAIRVPALQNLLMFAHEVDTNESCTRIVIDHWLQFDLGHTDVAQNLLRTVHALRSTLNEMMAKKLAVSASNIAAANERRNSSSTNFYDQMKGTQQHPTEVNETSTETELAASLTEFLETSVSHRLKRLRDFEVRAIFGIGATTANSTATKSADLDTMQQLDQLQQQQQIGVIRRPESVRVTEYLWWNSIPDRLPAAASFSDHMMQKWTCPDCKGSFLFNRAALLSHIERECPSIKAPTAPSTPATSTNKPPSSSTTASTPKVPQPVKLGTALRDTPQTPATGVENTDDTDSSTAVNDDGEMPFSPQESNTSNSNTRMVYWCNTCAKTLLFTPTEMLQHTKSHTGIAQSTLGL